MSKGTRETCITEKQHDCSSDSLVPDESGLWKKKKGGDKHKRNTGKDHDTSLESQCNLTYMHSHDHSRFLGNT